MDNPKVFMSHASEDKDSFVIPFAIALRERGLDVWVDRWEMLPGDSLVQKIFTEGIDEAAAVIVVVSATSVGKRWVTEELNAAVIKRIEQDALLIPVVLDGLESAQIPAPIRHLLHERVDDRSDFEVAADRVVRAVLDQRERPNMGSLPTYAGEERPAAVPGLDDVDALVLKLAGEEAVRDDGTMFQTQAFLDSASASLGVAEAQAIESLEVLDADRHVKLHRTLGRGVPSMASFDLTTFGLEAYANAFLPQYGSMQRRIVSELVSGPEQGDHRDLARKTDVPDLLTLHVLGLLEVQGLLGLTKSIGPSTHYFNLSPKLRRILR